MSTVEKFLTTSLMLVFVYLVLTQSRGATSLISSTGSTFNSIFRTLQGR